MSVEAELKATLSDPQRVRRRLDQRADAEACTYADRYFDLPDERLSKGGYELRVRTITDENGDSRSFLTFKEPAVDSVSGSKPEHETAVDDPKVITTVITALGVIELIAFEKRCANYHFTAHGRDIVATVVEVPELDGETFLEVETITGDDDVAAALDVVRTVLDELGVRADELTTQTYTDAVAARRSRVRRS